MDLLASYGDSDDDKSPATSSSKPAIAVPTKVDEAMAAGVKAANAMALAKIQAAPDVDLWERDAQTKNLMKQDDKAIFHNPKIEAFQQDIQGPVHPDNKDGLYAGQKNHSNGHIEKMNMSKFAFADQYQSFLSYGTAADPSDRVMPGKRVLPGQGPRKPHLQQKDGANVSKEAREQAAMFDRAAAQGMTSIHEAQKPPKRPKVVEGAGKWGGFADLDEKKAELELVQAKNKEEHLEAKAAEEKAAGKDDSDKVPELEGQETSVFHGKSQVDYQGRSWMHTPTESNKKDTKTVEEKKCFLPKKWIHSWVGHSMGINCVKLFPESGHLLLSASMDSKIKIWDYYNQRKCLRTYMGHDQAVRDIHFSEGGKKFYSASFDKTLALWDTETGQVIRQFTNKFTPYNMCVSPRNEMEFVAACSNKKAVGWDARSGEITQEYDEHLAAVTTVTLVDDGKRLVTTSDDRKVLIWDYGIPVVVKHVAEPHMHSIPAIGVHPTGSHFVGQSMDNQIVCFEGRGRLKYCPKRVWKGHMCSGYAIKPSFSADGSYLMSGDATGKLFFWDWKTMKMYRSFKAHDGVCMDSLWHPIQPSRVISAGWDGVIKLWD